jgi:hypothetical protein
VTGDVQVRLSAPATKAGKLQRAVLEVLRERQQRAQVAEMLGVER